MKNKKKLTRVLMVVVAIILAIIAISPKIIDKIKYNDLTNFIEEISKVRDEGGELAVEIIYIDTHSPLTTYIQAYNKQDYYLIGIGFDEDGNVTSENGLLCVGDKGYMIAKDGSYVENSTYCSEENIDDVYSIFKFFNYEDATRDMFDYYEEEGYDVFELKSEYTEEMLEDYLYDTVGLRLMLGDDELIVHLQIINGESEQADMYVTYDFDRYIEKPEQVKTDEN